VGVARLFHVLQWAYS